MLDEVWSFLRGDVPVGLYEHGHNIMLYKDDVPNVEVGVQVARSFDSVGHVVVSTLPGGLVATATHNGSVARIGDTHHAVCEWSREKQYQLAGPRWEILRRSRPIDRRLRCGRVLVARVAVSTTPTRQRPLSVRPISYYASLEKTRAPGWQPTPSTIIGTSAHANFACDTRYNRRTYYSHGCRHSASPIEQHR